MAEDIQKKYQALFEQDYSSGRSAALHRIEGLAAITGVRPSNEILVQGLLKILSEDCSGSGKGRFRSFVAKFGVAHLLPRKEIQQIYQHFLEEGRVYHIEDVAELTGVKPEYSEELVQKAYAKALEEGVCEGHLASFAETSGIVPHFPEELVQQKYKLYFERGYPLNNLRELKDLSGIAPRIDDPLIQERYKKLLIQEDWASIRELREILGVDFSRELISTLYHSMINKGSYGSLSRLVSFSGIEPDKESVIQRYKELLRNQEFNQARSLKLSLGGMSIPSDPEEVQGIYASLSGTYIVSQIEQLKKLTGIPPNKANTQRVYEILIRNGEFEELDELRKVTGIKPSKKVLKSIPF